MQKLCIYLPALLSTNRQTAEEIETEPGKPKLCSQSGIATRLKNLVPQQAVRIMKITAIILLAACLQVQAVGYGQKITLALKDAPVEKLFNEIREQAGYEFLYMDKVIQNAKRVNIKVKDALVDEVLKLCFMDQPFDFEIKDKTIIITPKKNTSPHKTNDPKMQIIDVKGRVMNSKGEPVPDATVIVQGSSKRTITNANGEFSLIGIDENAVILISHVQYEAESISLNGHGTVNATLQIKISSLDEMQVIAYGTTTKRLNTGNVSTVKGAEITRQPINNPLLALQGRVPGLFVTQTSGLSGSGVVVRIQGQNSLSNGNAPLYIVDGVPFPTDIPTPPGTSVGPLGNSGESTIRGGYTGRGNALTFINPSDIESIEVLKDADATAIYGSRAANGAILITTKKGQAGRTKVDINLQQGWAEVANKMDLLNTQQYLEMRNEAFKNDGLQPTADPSDAGYAPDLKIWDTTQETNWQKVLLGGTSNYTNINASVSGGIPAIQYFIGGTYHRETTVFPGDFSDERGSMHLNMNNNSSNQRFHFQVSANYTSDNNQLPRFDLTEVAVALPPNAPSLYDEYGQLNWAPNSLGNSTWMNPLAEAFYKKYQTKTNSLIANTNLSYEVVKGLKIATSLGYTTLSSKDIQTSALVAEKPEQRNTTQRSAAYGDSYVNSLIFEPQVTYNKPIGKGKLDALIGTTFQRNSNEAGYISGRGYANDEVLKNPAAAASLVSGGQIINLYKYYAVFGRFNYNLLNKYIINLTGRRDGSSRFGDNSKFHNFGAIGGAWIFSEEQMIKNNATVLSFGKLKASYGTTGSDQIGDYRFLTLYNTVTLGIPYQGMIGLSPGDIPNPDLEWEENRKLSMGIELGFLKNRIFVTGNYSKNKSSNQLLSYSLPRITGRSSILRNFPATVQNTNWEFTLSTINVNKPNFSWNSNINLTIARNKLVNFPDLASSAYASSLIIGEPINIQRVYLFQGVDPITGTYMVLDAHGNPTASPTNPDDATKLLTTFPKFYGGFQNSIKYKQIQLDVLFQFVKQTAYAPIYTNFLGLSPGMFSTFSGAGNYPVTVMDRWQKPGDEKPIQQFTATYSNVESKLGNALSSDAAYNDATYGRIKNVSISYELPVKWSKKAGLQYCRINGQGQNLFTITNYKGLDPESQSLSSLPPLRIFTVGVQIGL